MEACHRASVSRWLKAVVISCEMAAIITNIGAIIYYSWDLFPLFYDNYEVYIYALAVVELVALAVYPFTGALNGIYQRSTSVVRRIWASVGDRFVSGAVGLAEARQ